jgi:hypothetical protein
MWFLPGVIMCMCVAHLPMLAAGTAAAQSQSPPSSASEPEPKTEPSDPNPEVTVYLNDGRAFTGIELGRDEQAITIDIAGVPTRLSTSNIERIKVFPPVMSRYKTMRDALAPDDIAQRAALIRWLADRRQLDIADLEADLLALKFPDNAAASEIQREIKQRIDDRARAQEPELAPAQDGSDDSPRTPKPDYRISASEFPVLTADQINMIKVYELDLGASPSVSIPRDIVRQLMDAYSGNPLIPATLEERDALVRKPSAEIASLMFKLKAREFYPKIRVADHPPALRAFRDEISRSILLPGCATSGCHGGSNAGRLVFSTFRPTSDATVYTNFYVLNNYRTSKGESLIDFENPERSLLLQYALPRKVAKSKHPIVGSRPAAESVDRSGKPLPVDPREDQWKPALAGVDDPRYTGFVRWAQSLYRPRPVYTLEQYVPFRPLTLPAPAPTAPPTKAETKAETKPDAKPEARPHAQPEPAAAPMPASAPTPASGPMPVAAPMPASGPTPR